MTTQIRRRPPASTSPGVGGMPARAVERMRAAIQALVDRLLDDLGAQSGGDLVSLFAYPLPVMVICELLGVPTEDRDPLGAWSDALSRSLQVGAGAPHFVADGHAAA